MSSPKEPRIPTPSGRGVVNIAYTPPWLLNNGMLMTLYTALRASRGWEKTIPYPEPPYREHIFTGACGVPIFGLVAIP